MSKTKLDQGNMLTATTASKHGLQSCVSHHEQGQLQPHKGRVLTVRLFGVHHALGSTIEKPVPALAPHSESAVILHTVEKRRQGLP